jgi:hypothetical protein
MRRPEGLDELVRVSFKLPFPVPHLLSSPFCFALGLRLLRCLGRKRPVFGLLPQLPRSDSRKIVSLGGLASAPALAISFVTSYATLQSLGRVSARRLLGA